MKVFFVLTVSTLYHQKKLHYIERKDENDMHIEYNIKNIRILKYYFNSEL
jgi:hypothetical protein